MITSETQVRDFEQSQPLPSFRLRAPNINPFIPSFPASVTGIGPHVQFAWSATSTITEGSDQSGRLLGVVEDLRRDTERFPKSASVRINLAIALSNLGNFEEAEAELRGALILERDNYLARINLAHVLAVRGKFDEASATYEELHVAQPSDNTVLLSLAVMALRRGSFGEAEDKLRLAIANRDGEAMTHFLLGIVRLAMGNLGGAVSELRVASRVDVRNHTIHQALGVIFAVRSEFERAEHEFRAALMLAPNDRAAIRSLYQVLLKQKKAAEAVDLLKLFVEGNPEDFAAREALALGLIDLRQFGPARFHLNRLLGKAAESKDQLARIQANIGLSWFFEGKIERARTALLNAIETYPRVSPIAYENLARLYLSKDNPEAARDILIQARAVFPEHLVTALLLSHVYSLLGSFEKAIKELGVFRGRDDLPVDFYVHLSFFYSELRDFATSVEAAKEGLRRFPRSPMLVNNLAYVYAMTDQIEQARATLKIVGKDVPPHVQLVATKGLLRLREGDERRGVELYDEAERLAIELGNKELGRTVRQKKHLELARYLIRKQAFDRARSEIKQGLAVHVKHFSYEDDLVDLSRDIGSGRVG